MCVGRVGRKEANSFFCCLNFTSERKKETRVVKEGIISFVLFLKISPDEFGISIDIRSSLVSHKLTGTSFGAVDRLTARIYEKCSIESLRKGSKEAAENRIEKERKEFNKEERRISKDSTALLCYVVLTRHKSYLQIVVYIFPFYSAPSLSYLRASASLFLGRFSLCGILFFWSRFPT